MLPIRLTPLVRSGGFLLALLATAAPQAQTVVKYGAEFLAGGVGARALGMGGAYVARANDVTAGYWNVAGLSQMQYPEGAYMHAERFSGVVSFDYAAVALPLNERSTVGISFFRSGVDDIANTLAALNPDTGLPQANTEDHITFFSAADYAFFLSYARQLREGLSAGVTGKIIRRRIGPFASAWGYSFDVGAQMRVGRFTFGANLQDATAMLQSWSVDAEAFAGFDSTFGIAAPVGGTELVLPVARLGAATDLRLTNDITLGVGLDMDVAFDGQEAYTINAGSLSFRPRVGAELVYRDVVAFRAGISDVSVSDRFGTQITPTVGAGLNLGSLDLDYGFGDFGGLQSELGFSHRVSVRYTLARNRYARIPVPGTPVAPDVVPAPAELAPSIDTPAPAAAPVTDAPAAPAPTGGQ